MTGGHRTIRRVLLTNDDGITAPGLKVLEQAVARIAEEIWIVAPERDQSGTSHALTLTAPLRVRRAGERSFAVTGTPGDCVIMAVRHLMEQTPPDLILSGINRGANLGVETVFSGTVGAAMTGMLLGVPSIALSAAFTDGEPVRWETALAHAPDIIARLASIPWSDRACLNVNFPDVPPEHAGPLVLTRQGRGIFDGVNVITRTDPRDNLYHWVKFHRSPREDDAQSESTAIARGAISVTPLRFERTDDATFTALRTLLGQG